MLTPDVIIIGLYLLIQIAVGLYASKNIKTDTDFLLGGRSMGLLVSTFTVFATWYGAEAGIGAAGSVFSDGLTGARVEPFGYTMALLLCGFMLAQQLRARSYVTMADFFVDRFGPRIEKLVVLIMVPSTLIWTSAQIMALGQILTTIVPVSYFTALLVSVFVVTSYASFGGFLGSAYTDLIQSIVIIIGMVVLLFFGISELPTSLSEAWSQVQWTKPHVVPEPFWAKADSWAIPILGSLTSHELLSRVLATKTPQIARKATLIAALMYLFFGLIPVFLGLIGEHHAIPEGTPDQFLPLLAKTVLPNGIYVLFTAAIISAILSTADSALISATGLISQNLIKPIWPNLSQNKKVWINRCVVMGSGLFVFYIALGAERILELLAMASSAGTAGIFVTIVFGLWTKIGGLPSAVSCLLAGVIFPPFLEESDVIQAPYLLSVGICLIAYLLPLLLPSKKAAKA